MGNTSSIGGDTIKLTISKIITMTMSFIIVMILSRYFSLEEYGTYSQIIIIVNLVGSLFMLGLPNSINYFLARSETKVEKQKFLSVYYSLSTYISIGVGILLLFLTPFFVQYFNNRLLQSLVYFLAIYPWTLFIKQSIDHVLIVYKKLSLIMFYRIINSVSILLLLVIVQYLNLSFKLFMFIYILLEGFFAISVYFIVKKVADGLKIEIDKYTIKNILKYSIPIGLASAVGTLNIQLDKLMVGRYLGTELLGIYTNASRELPITIVATSLTAILIPQLTILLKKEKKDITINLWSHASILAFIIICFFALVFFTFASDVMNLLYSEKFITGVSVFRVFCLVLLLRFTYFGMILNAVGNTKFIFYSSIFSLFLNFCLNYVFLVSLGFIGPAIATLISQFVINVIQLVYTCKIIKIKFIEILPWKILGFILLINISFGWIFYVIKENIELDVLLGSIFESIILGTIWGGIYLLLFRKTINKSWRVLNTK